MTRNKESVGCHEERRCLAALAERKLRTEVRPPHVLPGGHNRRWSSSEDCGRERGDLRVTYQ